MFSLCDPRFVVFPLELDVLRAHRIILSDHMEMDLFNVPLTHFTIWRHNPLLTYTHVPPLNVFHTEDSSDRKRLTPGITWICVSNKTLVFYQTRGDG